MNFKSKQSHRNFRLHCRFSSARAHIHTFRSVKIRFQSTHGFFLSLSYSLGFFRVSLQRRKPGVGIEQRKSKKRNKNLRSLSPTLKACALSGVYTVSYSCSSKREPRTGHPNARERSYFPRKRMSSGFYLFLRFCWKI